MTNNKQQTGVEWYHQQIVDRQNGNGDSRSLDEIFEQSKEMEKQQIIDAVKYGYKKDNYTPNFKEQQELFKEYYEQTYGGNK
jgi:hypothetical protein